MKGKRTELNDNDCAIARSLDVIGDWWSLLIVRDARSGKRRFSEFQKHLGLAKNILATRLKKLVERGIMEMVPACDGSAFKEYVLTEKGEKLYVVIVALWQWGEENCFEPDKMRLAMLDITSGEALAPLEVRTLGGKRLGAHDFAVVERQAPRSTRRHTREEGE
ncbi:helix-turn-helix transcriptional regulator [Pandoraea sputorum]|uniref:winged helix-turn-helix transcriptional regulator n=1 Tax=Pandoraea sputorum TaxID=93222 RepID=UPI001E2CC4AF|nr:helix-turn-helix domain-containing protein [Pandoraea sputorum]MCE4062151.1 helix-turn-helix transcriptional regulator [Pandoraea sputorum]